MTSKESVLTRSDVKELIREELKNIIENDDVYIPGRTRVVFAEMVLRATILAQREIMNYILTISVDCTTSAEWNSETNFFTKPFRQAIEHYQFDRFIDLSKRLGNLTEQITLFRECARHYPYTFHPAFRMENDYQTPEKISRLLEKLISIVEDEEFLRKSLYRFEFETIDEDDRIIGRLRLSAYLVDAVISKVDELYESANKIN